MQYDSELLRILTLACDHLGMDAAYVSELTATQQVFRAVAGQAAAFGLVVDDDLDVPEVIGADMAQGYFLARPSTDRADWATWAVPDPRRALSSARRTAARG